MQSYVSSGFLSKGRNISRHYSAGYQLECEKAGGGGEIEGGDISWLYIFIMTSNGKTVDGEDDAERSV